jgi:hypothetical protein
MREFFGAHKRPDRWPYSASMMKQHAGIPTFSPRIRPDKQKSSGYVINSRSTRRNERQRRGPFRGSQIAIGILPLYTQYDP